jgi:hypothetical protein
MAQFPPHVERLGERGSLVRSSNFKNLATQMTTHGHAWTRKVTSNVTGRCQSWPEHRGDEAEGVGRINGE